MNIYVILIGAVLVILLVVFGRNPMEEAREAKKHRGGDPLVNAIEEYNSKPHVGNGFGMQQSSPFSQPVTTQPSYPAYLAQPAQNAPAPAYENQPAPQNSNSYYPPAAAGVPPSPLQQPK